GNNAAGYPINSDGASPDAGLILSGNTLYGTTSRGGSSGWGTVFKLYTDGTGFTTLYTFSGGSDGVGPTDGLILSGNTLYGGTGDLGIGSTQWPGTLFKLNTDGTGFTTLYTFEHSGLEYNSATALVLSGGFLYGKTWGGGSSGNGTVFKLTTDGARFT